MKSEEHNWVAWVLVGGLAIWGVSSLFGGSDTTRSNVGSSYDSYDDYSYEEDGYTWAENNDPTTFDECQDQFGSGYEEDACNEYVKENYSGRNIFNGYECTEDCSGHEAGYNWAEENGIYSEYDCGGNSDPFIEGCISYVEENY
jgi:hypothetical protein